MKKYYLIILFMTTSVCACNYDDCETACENKFIDGGVPLWTCAETCAICNG
jgi:hypothetical protein